jgi:hypothetical protein
VGFGRHGGQQNQKNPGGKDIEYQQGHTEDTGFEVEQ